MKIKKFNEKIELLQFDGEKLDKIALYVYDAGSSINDIILFDDNKSFKNYIVNYVNDFVSSLNNLVHEDFDGYDYIKDQNGKPLFTKWDQALDWLNYVNENSEPTLSFMIKVKYAKNVELDERTQFLINSKKYNI